MATLGCFGPYLVHSLRAHERYRVFQVVVEGLRVALAAILNDSAEVVRYCL